MGCIMGSSFHRVVKCKYFSAESVVKQLMQYESTDLTVPTVQLERQMEDAACQCYHTEIKKIHMNFNLKALSLTVKADESYMAASLLMGYPPVACWGLSVHTSTICRD